MRGMNAASSATTATDPHKLTARRRITQFANRSRKTSRPAFTVCVLNGAIAIKAGRENMENTQAAHTPIATTLPNAWNGGASLKFKLKNPIAVVTVVKSTG